MIMMIIISSVIVVIINYYCYSYDYYFARYRYSPSADRCSCRAKCTVFPSKDIDGLLFVWPESGDEATLYVCYCYCILDCDNILLVYSKIQDTYRPVFLESLLGFGVSSGEFLDYALVDVPLLVFGCAQSLY